MLLAALGSVRIGKNCDLGLENAALGLGQHFQDLGHSFSLYGPPSRPITYIYFFREEAKAPLASFHAGPLSWWNWNLENWLL